MPVDLNPAVLAQAPRVPPTTAGAGQLPLHFEPKALVSGAVMLAAAAGMFGIASSLGTGRWAFVLYMGAAWLMCGVLYCVAIRRVGASYSPKLLFFVNSMPPGYFLAFYLLTPAETHHLIPWVEALFDRPLRSALGLVSVPMGVAAVYFVKRLWTRRPVLQTVHTLVEVGGQKLELFLIVAAVVNLSYWVAVLDVGNPIFYLLRVLRMALSFSAFAAGFCAFRLRRARLAWLVSLSLGLLASLLTGGRGVGFIPVGFFLIGLFFGAPHRRARFNLILIIVPSVVGLLVLSGYIHSLRESTGRKTILEVLDEGSILQNDDDMFIETENDERRSFLYRGLVRVVSWPPAVVPAMTPEIVPYRGFGDLWFEIQDAFKIRILELAEAEGRRGDLEVFWSEISLLPYGFAVSATSSVEFGILADGYTRGGWWGAFLYGVIATIILLALESGLRKLLLPRRAALFGIILVVLCGFAVTSFQLNPLVTVIRTIVLNTTLALGAFLVLDTVLSSRSRNSTVPHRFSSFN